MTMSSIQIRNLSKHYSTGAHALVGVDLQVAEGELLALVGPSGSGKSTLLRLIAGLESPTEGTIHLDGINVTSIAPHRRDVALVFQDLALYSHLTVAGNLQFGGASQARVAEAAQLVKIEHLLSRYPAELSGGEQQRVALARAVVRRPKVLLLDEPLSSVDGPLRRMLRREIKQLQRELKVPAIYVTHDQAEAFAIADRLAMLDHGHLQQVGTASEVYHRPANRLVGEFFGPQGMNLIRGELNHREAVSGLSGDNVSVVVPPEFWPTNTLIDGPVLMGIRPSDVEIVPAIADSNCSAIGESAFVEETGESSYVQVRLRPHDSLPATRDAEPTRIMIRLRDHMPPPTRGELLHLHFRSDRLHWFSTDGCRLEN